MATLDCTTVTTDYYMSRHYRQSLWTATAIPSGFFFLFYFFTSYKKNVEEDEGEQKERKKRKKEKKKREKREVGLGFWVGRLGSSWGWGRK